MVVMALDHTRDWFSNSAALFDPLDLSRTTPELFFTRWITHFCAPIFVFLAGSGAYLALSRGRNPKELARFLAIRGLWLIFLEIFVISPFGWSFALGFAFTRLQVIWVIGVSMVIMGGLMLICSSRIIGLLGVTIIFTHDLFDGSHARWLGAFRALHQIAFFPILPHKIVGSVYPLIPWVGVMMAGYAIASLRFAQACAAQCRGSGSGSLFFTARPEHLRRSVTMVKSAQPAFHGAFLRALQQISAFASIPVDDSRPRIDSAWGTGRAKQLARGTI